MLIADKSKRARVVLPAHIEPTSIDLLSPKKTDVTCSRRAAQRNIILAAEIRGRMNNAAESKPAVNICETSDIAAKLTATHRPGSESLRQQALEKLQDDPAGLLYLTAKQ